MNAVKIIESVIHLGRLMKEGTVHELADDVASHLIDGGHAEEHDASAGPADGKPQSPWDALAKFTVNELREIATKHNAENPEKQITLDLLKAKKSEIVDAIAAAAGYTKPS